MSADRFPPDKKNPPFSAGNMTLAEWLVYHQERIAMSECRWMGLPCFKNPLDAWIYQEIIHETRPDFIVEIGSACGGSTLFFAHLCELLNHGTVISIDMDRSRYQARHPRIIEITGQSLSPETIDRVKKQVQGKNVMVSHDGSHERAQVLADLRAYAPLVAMNHYFVVEDGVIDLFEPEKQAGPLTAVREFLAEDNRFEPDAAKERYLLTYNPLGFLKRVR